MPVAATQWPVVAPESTQRLFEALAGPKELRWFETGHSVTSAMLRAALDFFRSTLAG